MARSTNTIEKSIADSIESINPSVDTSRGPIPEIFIIPQAAQLRGAELLLDNLSHLYSLRYILTRDITSLQLYGENHGIRQDPGTPARGNCTFFTYSRLREGETTVIPAGTVVTTTDSSVAFQTRRTAYIYGDRVDTYYNSTTRRYEILIPVEGLGTGEEFEVPAYRIRNLRNSIDGIDGVENRTRISGSIEAETNASFGKRIQNKFNGTALGSGSGLQQLVENYDPSRVEDVALVFSTDETLFKRWTRRPAWDVYVIGEDAEEETDTFTGTGSVDEFQLQNVPVISISEVLVNNIPVAYTLEKDTTNQTSDSSSAEDKLKLLAPPASGDEITCTYEYDKLMPDVQTYIDTAGRDLYEADILVRKAIDVPLSVTIEIQVLSSFDTTQAISDTFSVASAYLNPLSYVEDNVFYPEDLRNNIAGSVGGLSQVIITEFRRKESSTLLYDAIEFLAIEYPTADDLDITIIARQ